MRVDGARDARTRPRPWPSTHLQQARVGQRQGGDQLLRVGVVAAQSDGDGGHARLQVREPCPSALGQRKVHGVQDGSHWIDRSNDGDTSMAMCGMGRRLQSSLMPTSRISVCQRARSLSSRRANAWGELSMGTEAEFGQPVLRGLGRQRRAHVLDQPGLAVGRGRGGRESRTSR